MKKNYMREFDPGKFSIGTPLSNSYREFHGEGMGFLVLTPPCEHLYIQLIPSWSPNHPKLFLIFFFFLCDPKGEYSVRYVGVCIYTHIL